MPKNSLIKQLQDRIEKEKYEFYFSSRSIQGDNVVESRYYYFVDNSLMYHDKQERRVFLPVSGVMDRLDDIEPINKVNRPLYLDYLEYDFQTDSVTHAGFSDEAIRVLLEIFWSEKSPNLSDNEEILIKYVDKTQFLDLSERTFMNAPITITEE